MPSNQPKTHRYPEARKIDGVRTRYRTRHVKPPPKSAKHGLDMFERTMKLHGNRAALMLDKKSKAGKLVAQLAQQVIDAYGGDEVVTPQMKLVIRNTLVLQIIAESVANWMLGDPNRILNKRKRSMHVVVPQLERLSKTIAETWDKIGFHPTAPDPLTIADLLAESDDPSVTSRDDHETQPGGDGSD